MTSQQQSSGAETTQVMRDFLASYDGQSAARQLALQIRALLQRELYRRERDRYSEWVDLGGEA